MYGITNLYMIEDYSHYSIVKDLLRLTWCVTETPKIQHSNYYYLFECSTSGSEKYGGGEEARTPDLRLAKPALCQLSYTP